jgi:hypothetical protein
MELTTFHTFADPPGSLTFAVRREEHWWCHFAHYGRENHRSVLVRYDERWREAGRWTYPAELVADWGAYSLSGGLWQGDHLLATGHDKRVIYRLKLPEQGRVMEVVEVLAAPFRGQGIAADPKTGGLVGIDRAKRQVLFASLDGGRRGAEGRSRGRRRVGPGGRPRPGLEAFGAFPQQKFFEVGQVDRLEEVVVKHRLN